MGRSRKQLQEAIDLYNRALSGDADAFMQIWEIMQDGNKTNGGVKNGKNKQRNDCRKKSKRG